MDNADAIASDSAGSIGMDMPTDPLEGVWMLHPPPRLPPPRFVRPVPVDPVGLRGPTPGQARGPHWRRTSRNRYVPSDANFDATAQRIVEVAESLPAGAAVTAWASMHLAGAQYFDGTMADGSLIPVPVALGPSSHRVTIPGARVHRESIDGEVVERHGIPCLSIHRSLLDETRRVNDVRRATVAIDMACHAQLTSLSRFAAYVASQPRRKHKTRVRRALALADERSESPQETLLRLRWILDAGLPPPLVNRNVYSLDGRFLARPDLLDATTGVVGEYDGQHHRETARRRADIDREEDLRSHGLEYFSVVAGEMNQPGVIRRMSAARGRAQASRMPARWTIERPAHLTPQLTLDELLDRRPPPR